MSIKLSRREMLIGSALGSIVAGARAANADEQNVPNAAELLQVNDLDRQIWQQELDPFVPARLYDMHSHLSRAEFNLDPKAKGNQAGADPAKILEGKGSIELLNAVEALLYPGRETDHLLMPNPYEKCDFTAANNFVAAEAKKKPGTRALMVVHPGMTADEVEKSVVSHRFVGFKPYPRYARTGKSFWEARIPDFIPEHLIAVANRYGLIIGLHMSKSRAIADPENLDDLERLTEKYPRVRWILYHNARSHNAWPIEEAAPRLGRLHNISVETSSVCESVAFDASFSIIPSSRLMYGTDDFSVGLTRGKYVAWGHGWAQMDRHSQSFQTNYCDGRMTFVRYEMLRAIRRAATNQRFSKQQIEDLFYNNAERLVNSAWNDLNDVLGS